MSLLKRKVLLGLHRLLRGDKFHANGVDVVVPASVDAEIRYLLLRGRPYEQAEAILARKALRLGMNVLELGGSIGVISAVVRSIIGPEASHVIVEADDDLAKVCAQNASRGAKSGLASVVRGAVDYSGASHVFFDSGHNAHTGHVDPNAKTGTAVPALTATAAAAGLPEGPFALVCDIEGAEYPMILQDAALLPRLSAIIMELHPPSYAKLGGSTEMLLGKLAENGFTLREQIENVVLLTREA